MRSGSTRTRPAVEWSVVVLLFALAGAAAAAVVRPPPASPSQAEGLADGPPEPRSAGASVPSGVIPALVLNGRTIDLAAPVRPQVMEAARDYLSGAVVVRAGGESRTFTRAQLGATIPVTRIADEIQRALREDSPLRRVLDRGGREHRLPVLVEIRDDMALGRLLAFKNEFDRDAVPAKYDFVANQIRPEEIGRRLMLYKALATLQDAFESGAAEVELPVEPVEPSLRVADLAGAEFSKVMGFYETPYARIEQNVTRNFNLAHAASFVDGTIVPAHGVFDFNATVGERSEVRGFKVAPVIAEGELVDGIGGGTCQIASTTFAASFFAGLDLLRRRPHSRPSSYVLLGLDATVAYPSINLELRNPFDFPIAFRVTVSGGKVRAEVRGAERVYSSSVFIRDVYQVYPFPQQVVEVADWPAGLEVIGQRGINGYRLRRHRILCRGTACTRESAESHYPPTTHIVKRGTNQSIPLAGFEAPAPDPHPPYSADRHMMVTETENDVQILRRP